MVKTSLKYYYENEAHSLLQRVNHLKPFSLSMPMVPSASISQKALQIIESFLLESRNESRKMIYCFLNFLKTLSPERMNSADIQQKFSVLRLRFNDIFTQIDIFADVINQRSEHETGVWISALDYAAKDALSLPGEYFDKPELICYLDRGHGAAIRRARTRLPGGKSSPVAVIRVPRERMIGSGVASSLFHEVGHQGAALLNLVDSSRMILNTKSELTNSTKINTWVFWHRWISEIIADFWSISKLGIGSTLGLISVVSLPSIFLFRINLDDPHPFPWIRVKLSCEIGKTLYPHPQWDRLSNFWDSLYHTNKLPENKRIIITALLNGMKEFVDILMNHRPTSLYGQSLHDVFSFPDISPTVLQQKSIRIIKNQLKLNSLSPSLAFAVIGQGKFDGNISADDENHLLMDLLKHWALKKAGDYCDRSPFKNVKYLK